jgi:hypothetical protein
MTDCHGQTRYPVMGTAVKSKLVCRGDREAEALLTENQES